MALTGDVYDDAKQSPEQTTALTEAALADHDKAIENEDPSNESSIGAGCVAGVTGLVLCGPIVGAATGAGAYYLAATNQGPAGEVARSTGDFVMKTGAKGLEAAKEADERHHILDKVHNFFTTGWNKVCQFNEEHKVAERAKETMSDVGTKTKEFEKEHHFFENILLGIKSGIDFLIGKVRDATGNQPEAVTSNQKTTAAK